MTARIFGYWVYGSDLLIIAFLIVFLIRNNWIAKKRLQWIESDVFDFKRFASSHQSQVYRLWIWNYETFKNENRLVKRPPKPEACPNCANETFFEGPHGGASVNVMCSQCKSKFCYMGPFGMMPIDNPDSVYCTSKLKRLAQL